MSSAVPTATTSARRSKPKTLFRICYKLCIFREELTSFLYLHWLERGPISERLFFCLVVLMGAVIPIKRVLLAIETPSVAILPRTSVDP